MLLVMGVHLILNMKWIKDVTAGIFLFFAGLSALSETTVQSIRNKCRKEYCNSDSNAGYRDTDSNEEVHDLSQSEEIEK